jgi:hypothetical protein
MPLDKPTLVQAIINLKNVPATNPYDPTPAAQALADAIDAFVRSGDVVGVTVHRATADALDSAQSGTGRIQ